MNVSRNYYLNKPHRILGGGEYPKGGGGGGGGIFLGILPPPTFERGRISTQLTDKQFFLLVL